LLQHGLRSAGERNRINNVQFDVQIIEGVNRGENISLKNATGVGKHQQYPKKTEQI